MEKNYAYGKLHLPLIPLLVPRLQRFICFHPLHRPVFLCLRVPIGHLFPTGVLLLDQVLNERDLGIFAIYDILIFYFFAK